MSHKENAKIICVTNQKGGVSKTTTTYNLSAEFALNGHKTLMIDLDGQASLTLSCGYNPLDFSMTMADVIDGSTDLKNIITHTDITDLDLAPASIKLVKSEVLMQTAFSREQILKSRLKSVSQYYEYIFIDCGPSLGILPINALAASDYVIIPTATNPMSTYALDDLMATIQQVAAINSNLKVLGTIATMFHTSTKIDREQLQYIKENTNLIGTIKYGTAASKGLEQGLPAVVACPNEDVAKQYKETALKIMQMVEE
ncbi:MAG: AAA family ATPase [Lactimicrobium massiliense]|nr:AAA family ATPase [Lactimicrobium massiliense]MDD6727590.1 AAA family ATPase [Lactimicrobium massiliense]